MNDELLQMFDPTVYIAIGVFLEPLVLTWLNKEEEPTTKDF